MARERPSDQDFARPLRRILLGIAVLVLLGLFVLWRIDNPRVERLRAAVVDRILPSFDWALVPAASLTRMLRDFRSYAKLYEQNQELRRELQRLKGWREAALQLEQKNAALLELNKVRVSPRLTWVTGRVLADSGSPFRKSVLLNVGRRDGVVDGWAVTDGLGLVGRLAGVGNSTSRVILLTDSSSRIPVTIQPSGQRAILAGTNGPFPALEFLEDRETISPGDRVVSSGDGRLFPPEILVGHVVRARGGGLLVRPAADFARLQFLRVLRTVPVEQPPPPEPVPAAGADPAAAGPDAPPPASEPTASAPAGGSDG